MKTYEGKNVPIVSWCNDPEEGVLTQARNLASLPFIFKQVCLAPDCHQGYGMPIGGIIACKNAVIPNAVGSDVSCGVCTVKTPIKMEDINTDILKNILGKIRDAIPVGFNHHAEAQEWAGFDNAPDIPVIKRELTSAKRQLGSLGSGNHFLEFQKDEDDYIYIMIHSGSRNLGYKVAKEYNKIAQDMCKMWYSDIPPVKGDDGLAFLPIGTKEAREYIAAMNFCTEFALANRKNMMRKILGIIEQTLHFSYEEVINSMKNMINIAHNYARLENHFGQNVWIHRKGATSARKGEVGIIPGSQGDSSYIVEGIGNEKSFASCSHGAGRKMSRTKARNELSLENEVNNLESLGTLHSIRNTGDLDEAPSAYKDIENVMDEQKDLVKILVKLEPIATIKG